MRRSRTVAEHDGWLGGNRRVPSLANPAAGRPSAGPSSPFHHACLLAALMVAYLALELPTLPSFGILWDEQADIDIARSYVTAEAGWLRDPGDDPTQTRLPMYAVAVLFALFDRSDLQLARLVSCLVSLLTLAAVYVHGQRFGRDTATIATVLVATSPFFLAFARVSFTEGDAFVTAGLAWTVVLLARAIEGPTLGRTALAGVIYGLTISAKFVAISILPAIALAPWVLPGAFAARARGAPAFQAAVVACGAFVAQALVLGWFHWYRPPLPERASLAWLAWGLAALAYAAALAWCTWHGERRLGRLTMPATLAFLAFATFVFVPPVHLTSPMLLGSLKDTLLGSAGFDMTRTLQSGSLHTLVLLLKPSPPVGIALWTALGLAAWRWRVDPRVRLPLLVIAAYSAFLLTMPVAQTFYTMPIFPWCVLLAADRLAALWRVRRLAAAACAALAVAGVAVDLARTYPHYQLNGYQWLGARYVLGISTLSYRSVVQVNSDGTEQALRWLNAHVGPGATVKTFIRPNHIVRAVSPRPPYTLIDGLRPPSPSVDDADYVVTTLVGDIRRRSRAGLRARGSIFAYPYDRAALVRGFEPVFRVERPFGLEFATVWRRRADRSPVAEGATGVNGRTEVRPYP